MPPVPMNFQDEKKDKDAKKEEKEKRKEDKKHKIKGKKKSKHDIPAVAGKKGSL